MEDGGSRKDMLRQLFETAGLKLPVEDLAIVCELHARFAGQRSRLSGVARPETEPMTIPAFDRVQPERRLVDEPIR